MRVGERLPWRITDITDFIMGPQQRPGLNAYASNAALMMHLLLHAAGSMPTKMLRLVQLHDIALLASRMTGQDWEELIACVSYPLPGTKFYDMVKAQLGGKRHWQESNDLAMMFHGTYTSDFYRSVRNLQAGTRNRWHVIATTCFWAPAWYGFQLRRRDDGVRGGCQSPSAITDPDSVTRLTYRVSAVTNNPLCMSASAW